MITKRPLIYIAALSTTVLLASLVNVASTGRNYSQTYPDVVCPPRLSGLNSQVSVSPSSTQFQNLENRSSKTVPFKTTRYVMSKSAVVIAAQGITPIAWQSRPGGWAGGVLCSGPAQSQWFVGGSADVTTRGHLIITNSGLSDAIVDIQSYSENGKQPVKSINLKSKNFASIALDSLAPGDHSLAVLVTPRSGRINSFMIDEQGAGLKSLGGDFVNAISVPATDIMIPAVPNEIQSKTQKNSSSHTLRILAPGNVETQFTAEILTTDGRFIPVGLNAHTISAGVVAETTFSPSIAAKVFAVHITSQEPVVASISTPLTSNGHKDFVWSTSVPTLSPLTMAISGLTPLFTFAGDSISVELSVTFLNGKKRTSHITGTDIAAWRAPANAKTVTFISTNNNTYGGAIVTSTDGYGYFPVEAGSVLTRVEVPNSNIRVLNP